MSDTKRTTRAPKKATGRLRERLLSLVDDYKPVTDKRARERAYDAFQLGVDAGYGDAARDLRERVNGPDSFPSDWYNR